MLCNKDTDSPLRYIKRGKEEVRNGWDDKGRTIGNKGWRPQHNTLVGLAHDLDTSLDAQIQNALALRSISAV
jgi:hypothetical protein